MGAYLNDPDTMIGILEKSDGSDYLVISMPECGVYFTGKDEIWTSAELMRQNRDKNPWEVMAYIAAKLYPDECGYVPPRKIESHPVNI